MIATWLGGPYDGRSDEIPDGVRAVSVAVVRQWGIDALTDAEVPVGDYREARCEVVADIRQARWVILWHEPQ